MQSSGETLKALKHPREATKEVFWDPEAKDQTQPANIRLSTSEVFNTRGLIDMVPVNEESDL